MITIPDTKLMQATCDNTTHEHRSVDGWTICDVTASYWPAPTVTVTTEVTYTHRVEYSTKNKDGSWTEPVFREHNATNSLEMLNARHKECKDFQSEFSGEFEGIYGYSWKNCRTVMKTTTVTVITEEV